jgi:hypothetical protein
MEHPRAGVAPQLSILSRRPADLTRLSNVRPLTTRRDDPSTGTRKRDDIGYDIPSAGALLARHSSLRHDLSTPSLSAFAPNVPTPDRNPFQTRPSATAFESPLSRELRGNEVECGTKRMRVDSDFGGLVLFPGQQELHSQQTSATKHTQVDQPQIQSIDADRDLGSRSSPEYYPHLPYDASDAADNRVPNASVVGLTYRRNYAKEYLCEFEGCSGKRFFRKSDLLRHELKVHRSGDVRKSYQCASEHCGSRHKIWPGSGQL